MIYRMTKSFACTERTMTSHLCWPTSFSPIVLQLVCKLIVVFVVVICGVKCDQLLDTRLRHQMVATHSHAVIKLDGDLIFGGLFPMHDSGDEMSLCGAIKEEKGIQRLEAMLYAIDMINADHTLLPNLTIGGHILDTCSRDTFALEQTMEFVKSSLTTVDSQINDYQCADHSSPRYIPRKPVVGVIGASSSSVSVMVANILRLFQIPQISYASTSADLSDKSRFGYFSRTVPPDNFQAQAMVDIVKLFNWSYVSTIATEGDYGEKGIEHFKILANREGICVAESAKISRNAKHSDFLRIIEQLSSKGNARVVVLFVDEDNCRRLLSASQEMGREGYFLWLGSDSWGKKIHPVKGQEESAGGAITILPKRKPLKGFDEYFKRLRPSTNTRNPWFMPFWEQHFNCTFALHSRHNEFETKRLKRCTGDEKLSKYEQEGLVPFVVDAVYAVANAIHNLLNDRCGRHIPHKVCLKDVIKGPDLLAYIRNVSFKSLQGNGMVVKFNADGDAPGNYDIFQYQRVNRRSHSRRSHDSNHDSSGYDYVAIGEWANDRLTFDLSHFKWYTRMRYYRNLTNTWVTDLSDTVTVPISACSLACAAGQYRQYHESNTCCWHCTTCFIDEYVYNETYCMKCAKGFVPNEDKSGCVKLPIDYMKWDSPWTIVPASFASLGIFATLFTIAVFLRFNDTPIIMASGRELCYILLSGIMLCYAMSFVILSKPTLITCTITRIGLSLGLCICYSAILTKTNRISRIFNRGIKNGMKRPSYTSPRSQIVICMCLVTVQLVFIIAWIIRDPPSIKEVIYNQTFKPFAVLQCGISSASMGVSLVYNKLLIIMCTTYAFKTRKIPENFNEAKYIGFTMYSTCIVWLAFIPIYFGTNNDFKIQIASLCMCLSISATVALGCLFVPKLYICLFQSYKNVRHVPGINTQQSNSTSGVLRFARPTCSAIIGATAMVSAHHCAPMIVIPEPSSGDMKTTSTTNGEWTSPSAEESADEKEEKEKYI
ncbi:metabotropic glutamate receptor 8-like [Oppia nitens]|uniref:metabotropic glutamate receptor 8-like n=1 Tax=Oppia nitens TaxID=1686743 RepID=UPI0023DC29E6|nr:metabotropic glutamate receptor 8-like [Oppia nitens]